MKFYREHKPKLEACRPAASCTPQELIIQLHKSIHGVDGARDVFLIDRAVAQQPSPAAPTPPTRALAPLPTHDTGGPDGDDVRVEFEVQLPNDDDEQLRLCAPGAPDRSVADIKRDVATNILSPGVRHV
jgi:hypothetical protein